jgi:hypothetical protein
LCFYSSPDRYLAKRMSFALRINNFLGGRLMFNSKIFYGSVIFFVLAAVCIAIDFSIDQASPEYPATYSSADIVYQGGGTKKYTATDLGLIASDEVTSFCGGADNVFPAGSAYWSTFHYSVDRATVGTLSSVINTESTGNGAAGDIFRIVIDGGSNVAIGPTLLVDATVNGLSTITPGPQSDIDAINTPGLGVWFSVNAVTATRLTGAGLACTSGDILYQATPGPSAPLPVVWATRAQLGLVVGDDIDALMMSGAGGTGLNPGTIVYISLAPTSPSAGALGTATAIQVYPGPPAVVFNATSLGLLAGDNINAMTACDPGAIPTISQWGLIIITILLLVVGIIFIKRRQHVLV